MHDINPQPAPYAGPGAGDQPAKPRTKPHLVTRVCGGIIRWTLLTLVFLVPLFFLPWTNETTELNKQLLVFLGAAIAGLAWLGKMLAERKFEYRRTVVNVIVLLFLAVYGLSTWLSQSTYMSAMGDFGQEKAGFFTVLSFVVLYLVAVNNIQSEKELKKVFAATVLGGFVAAVYGLLQGLGLYALPFPFAQTPSFNTVGTVASLGIYLAFIITLCGGILLYGHGSEEKPKKLQVVMKVIVAITAILSLFLIAALDFWPVTLSLLVASAVLIGFAFVHAKSLKGLGGILLPIAAVIISLLLLFFRFPISLGYPAEIMPSGQATRHITLETLRENPFFGSGPGTFIFDYAKHRSPEVNETAFWNVRFDRGSTRFFTLLATVGLLGTLSWVLVAVFLLGSATRKLLKADERTWHVLIGMFAAMLLLVVSKFLYSSTLTLEFMFWITMALLVVVHKHDFYSVRFERSPRAAMVLSFLFILGLVFTLSGLFVVGQRYVAEIKFAKALQADQAGDVDLVIERLSSAANLNQSNDVYLRNLSLALIAKGNQLLNEPMGLEKGEEESDEDFKNRQRAEASERLRAASALTAQAVNIARRGTEINPANVANWSVLAAVYQGLMGVTEGADVWAQESFEKAIELEPNNPKLHTELGKILLAQAGQASAGLETEDEAAKAEAQAKVDELLGQAVDSLNRAVELKGDYAPAHFNLSLALDRQGKLDEAITKMENVVRLNPTDVGVGFQLALLYYRSDRKDDAISLMESVVRLSPTYANARWYLSAMYDERGEKDKAIAQLEKVLETNPGNELIQRRLDQLKGIGEPPEGEEGAVPPEGEEGAVPPEGELPPPVEQPTENAGQPAVGQ
ncbi:tetratricopeptide repeat protein [Patescibacteria group bacterium]